MAYAENGNEYTNAVEIESNETREIDGQIYKVFEISNLKVKDLVKPERSYNGGFQLMSVGDKLLNWQLQVDWIGRGESEFPFPAGGMEVTLMQSGTSKVFGKVVYTKDKINTATGIGTPVDFLEVENVDPTELGNKVKLGIPDSVIYDSKVFLEGTPQEGYKITAAFKQKVNPLFKSEWHIKDANKPSIDAYVIDTNDSTKIMDFYVPKNDNEIYSIYDTQLTQYWDGNKLVKVVTGTEARKSKNENYRGVFGEDNIILGNAADPSIEFGYGESDNINNTGFVKDNNKKYLLNVFGDHLTIKRFAVFEALNVKLNSGAGMVGTEAKKDLKVSGKDTQEIGHSEMIKGNESGREISFTTDETVVVPKVKVGNKEVDTTFVGWATKTQTLTDGKLSAIEGQLVDANGNLTDAGKTYTFTKKETTLYAVFQGPEEGAANVKYVYVKNANANELKEKYASIPGSKDGKITGNIQDNVSLTYDENNKAPSFEGYKFSGTIVVDPQDAKYVKEEAGAKLPTVYVVYEAEKIADKYIDKLDPKDIKVWVNDTIDWKDGIKVKGVAEDSAENKALKTELAKEKAKVEDLGENGTIAQKGTVRNSDVQNLPNGKKGNLLVTFNDGSTLVVNDQTLYVADQKVEEKDPKDKDYINPDLLPKDKVKVEIKLGEGVKEAKQDGKVGDAANPVVIKTYYVKPGTGLAVGDFPTTTGKNAEIVKQANHKDPIKWNTNELTKTFTNGETGSFVASADLAVCKTSQALQKEFEDAIDPMFENIKKKDGVYLGKYDKANKKVTVAIIDKTKAFSELKGTGLVAGIKDLLKNYNLIKYQVGNQPARDLKAIEKASGTEQELVNNLAQIVGADIGNEINGQGNNINTLADFIDKKITLKLTVQEPDCEANKVTLTYTIEGKEAISSILKGKLSPQDIKVWKGDTIDWEMGVKKDETGLTEAQKEQIKDEFSKVENGVKTVGKAKFEDATTPVRDSKAASVNPFIGNIKVTFSDGSELLVEQQNLYVSELMTGKNNENAPDDAIEVKFLLGKGVKATKGATEIKGAETPVVYETYKVKPKLNLDEYKLGTNKTIFVSINAESMDKVKYSDIVWTPADHVVTKTNKEFTANATEAFIMKHEFKLLDKDNNNAEITVLPQVLKDRLPADKTVAKGKTYIPENLAPIKEVKDGEIFYDYTFVKWELKSDKDGDKTFLGTWTREQSKSAKPQIKTPIEGDKVIEGKGKPGSDIEVTIPGVKDPIHTTVDNNGKWKVDVPKDKELKSGEKIVAKQTEKGKKPSESTAIVETDKPSCMTPAPEMNPVYDSDEYITGRGIPGAVIEVRYRDYPILRTKVDTFGEWEVYTPYPLEDEQFVYARQIKEPCDPSVWVSEEIRYDYEYWRKDDKKEEPKKPVEIKKVWTPAELNARDHFSYIKGYGDNTFGPNRTITRAEVAMIFARLSINQSVSGAPQFKDVKAGDWYKTAVDIVARQGVVKGYEDGTFRPNQPITRREFAAIAARYAGNIDTWRTFRDVPSTDWAYTLINRVGGAGWITGYEDNTFRPNNNITRAEVVAIVNRMLNRKADKAYVDNNLMRSKHSFIDNLRSAWYFYDVHEAAVGHSFERQPNGVDEKWNRVTGQAFEIRER